MTQFVRISNGAIVEGPSDLTAPWKAPNGITYTGLSTWAQSDLASLGWVPVADAAPTINAAYQSLLRTGVSLVNGVPTTGYSVQSMPLAQFQTQRCLEVDALLLQKSTAGVTVSGPASPVQVRDGDRANIVSAAVQAQLSSMNVGVTWPANFAWRLADNSMYALATAAAMIAFAAEVAAAYEALRLVSWKHKDAIRALTDEGQIAAYDITTGW